MSNSINDFKALVLSEQFKNIVLKDLNDNNLEKTSKKISSLISSKDWKCLSQERADVISQAFVDILNKNNFSISEINNLKIAPKATKVYFDKGLDSCLSENDLIELEGDKLKSTKERLVDNIISDIKVACDTKKIDDIKNVQEKLSSLKSTIAGEVLAKVSTFKELDLEKIVGKEYFDFTLAYKRNLDIIEKETGVYLDNDFVSAEATKLADKKGKTTFEDRSDAAKYLIAVQSLRRSVINGEEKISDKIVASIKKSFESMFNNAHNDKKKFEVSDAAKEKALEKKNKQQITIG